MVALLGASSSLGGIDVVKTFVALLLLLSSLGAFALQNCTQYNTGSTGWFDSPGESCGAYVASLPSGYAAYMTSADAAHCYWASVTYPGWGISSQTTVTRTGLYCADPVCSAGVAMPINITLGYSGHDNGSDTPRLDYLPSGARNPTPNPPTIPATLCVKQGSLSCVVTMGSGGGLWMSRQPTASGMYRISQDYSATTTGATCTQSSADGDLVDATKAAPATCPGNQGYINGRPACVPKDSTVASPAPGSDSAPHTEGNPTAATSPASAPSARIPAVNGDGGNKGGPTDPRDGTVVTPTGTRLTSSSSTVAGTQTATAGVEQLNCGAPGQAACRIDETGTRGTTTMALDEAGITAAALSNRGTITGTGDKGFFSTWTSLWDAPPVGTCSPFSMPSYKDMAIPDINPCGIISGGRDVMAVIWALVGLWACVGMIREVI